MTDLVVRTVRIGGTVPGSSPRVAVEALLQAMAPTVEDHSVLIARRLQLTGFRGDDARSRLAELRRRAARPALAAGDAGWSVQGAEAVWFHDEAEALACLTTDLIAGSAASRWYWRSRLPRAPCGTSRLAQVWVRDVRWLPAALRLLESGTPGASVRAAAALTSTEAALVLAALLPGVGRAPSLRAATSRLHRGPGAQVAQPEPEMVLTPGTAARWSRLLPAGTASLMRLQRDVLATALVLAVEPAAKADELQAWARAVDLRAAGPIADGWPTAGAQAPVPQPNPDRTSVPSGVDEPTPGIGAGNTPSRPGKQAPGSPVKLNGTTEIGAAEPAPRPGPQLASISTEPIEPARDHTQAPAPGDQPEPLAYGLLDPWPNAFWSAHATACYLLNLLLRCNEEPSWADLLRLARRVLRGRPGARRRARDPLWRVLRDLSGADRLTAAPLPAWWRPALDYLCEHHLGPEVFAQPGRIAVTRTHVDVVLDLEQTDLAVRINGLDQNPGWVRSLGRIVSFHFEDRERGLR